MVNSPIVGRRTSALLAITLLCAGLSGCATQANVVDLERDLALLKLRLASEGTATIAAPARELGMVRASSVSPGGIDLADNPTELLDLTVSVDQLRTELSEIRGQMDELLYSLNSLTEDNDARLAALEHSPGGVGVVGTTPVLTMPPRFPNVGGAARGRQVKPASGLANEPLLDSVAVTPPEAIAATRPAAHVVPGPQGAVVLPGVMIAPRADDLVRDTAPSGLVPAGSVSSQTAYSLAARDLEQGHNSLAAAGFANFLSQYPDSPRVPLAAYSLGLAYMRQGAAIRAVDVWQQQAATFPGDSTAPATLLSLGEAYRTLDNIPAAERALKQLIARFPTAEQAEQAKLILSELR